MSERPDWHTYFARIADAVSARGDCRRSRVGAVLVDSDNRIISTGYNGTSPGQDGCLAGACPRGFLTYAEQPADVGYAETKCIAVHAEENALNYALGLPGQDGIMARLHYSTLYVTRRPCPGCRSLLTEYGVRNFIWPSIDRTALGW